MLEGLSNKIHIQLLILKLTLFYANGIYFSYTTKARLNILQNGQNLRECVEIWYPIYATDPV